MKKQVLTALALMSIAAASCKVDVETAPAPVFGEEFVISADCGSPDTRMERDGAGKMYWSPGDEIGVFVIQEDGTQVDRNERFTGGSQWLGAGRVLCPPDRSLERCDAGTYRHFSVCCGQGRRFLVNIPAAELIY